MNLAVLRALLNFPARALPELFIKLHERHEMTHGECANRQTTCTTENEKYDADKPH
jgi:hypothetical protein